MKKTLIALMLVLALVLGLFPGIAEDGVKEVTLTMAGAKHTPQREPIPWNETETWKYVFDYIEENYGYRLTVNWIDYDADKINLMVSGGEYTDIVWCGGQETAYTIINNGAAIDFNEYADKCKFTFSEIYEARNDLMCALTGGKDGCLYFLPLSIGAEYVDGDISLPRGYTLNWEWYKELGCPEINSDDDYIEILAQMVENHPENAAGEKVYAYGIRSDNFSYWFQRAAMCAPALMSPGTFDGYLYMEGYDDHILYDGYTNTERSAYWQDMEFLWKLNQLGIFDQESFTQTNNECKAKMAAGRYAGVYRPVSDLYNAMRKTDKETLMGYTAVPSKNAIVYANILHPTGYYPDSYMFIPKSGKNIEAALAFVDAIQSPMLQRVIRNGIPEKHWTYVDGVPTYTDEVQKWITTGAEEAKYAGINVTSIMWLQPATIIDDGYPVLISSIKENLIPNMNYLQKDIAATYGVALPSVPFMEMVEKGETIDQTYYYGATAATAREEMPSDISRILSKCNNLFYTRMADLVMAETWEDFQAIQAEMIAECATYGEAEAWEWCSEAHQKATDIIKPMYDAYVEAFHASK